MRGPVVLLVALLLAGCATPAALPETSDPATTSATPALGALGLAGTGCIEGGGHSVHPRSFNPLPEPWAPADVLDDVGPQLIYSESPDPAYPIPTKGQTMGNYHATMWCEGWTLDGEERHDIVFGFVGMRVEPPPFDDARAPADHHYLVTVVATDDDAVHARLAAAGFAPMKASATREELPDGTLRIQMHTDGNGDYDSLFRPKPMGAMDATRVRLWFQASPEEHEHGESNTERRDRATGEFRPIALDLVATGGEHLVADTQGYFSHTGTDHHFPFPGAYGQVAALLYRDFGRTFEWGPRPDVVLTEAYLH